MPNPGFKIPDAHYATLFNRISYSHFAELIRLDDPLKRLFYELESVKNTRSVVELKRQIGSLLFERTGLSKNKEKLLASLNNTRNSATRIYHQPLPPMLFAMRKTAYLAPSQIMALCLQIIIFNGTASDAMYMH